jgi:hypothetical protein
VLVAHAAFGATVNLFVIFLNVGRPKFGYYFRKKVLEHTPAQFDDILIAKKII